MSDAHPFDGIVTNTDTVKRDGKDRPMVFAADHDGPLDYTQGKTVKGRTGYTRTTTYVDCLDDKTAIDGYHQRNVLIGLAAAPHLLAEVANLLKIGDPNDPATKRQLNYLADEARDAAREDRKADMGTAIHAWGEEVDLLIAAGQSPQAAFAGLVDQDIGGYRYSIDDHRADVAAYYRATHGLLRPVAVETLVVIDDLKVAGTPDRLVEWIGRPVNAPNGALIKPGDILIDDTKTGSIEYGIGKFAMQMGTYAHGEYYDQATNTRRPLPAKLRRDWAIIVHVPAGQGRAELLWLDIAAGWQAVLDLAGPVRAWRSAARKLATPFPPSNVLQQIDNARTADEVRSLWTPEWSVEVTTYAAARAASLDKAAA